MHCAPRYKRNRRANQLNQYYHHVPRMNVVKSDDQYHMQFVIPGIEKEQVNIRVDNQQLVISHTKDDQHAPQNYLKKGFNLSGFSRTIDLPKNIDPSKIEARHTDGILYIVLPVAEAARPKKITIS